MSVTDVVTDARDPEAFCVCGHHEDEHADARHLPRARWPRRCQHRHDGVSCHCGAYWPRPDGRHRAD